MEESPGMDERSADRLRYPGRKRVAGFVGVLTGFGRSGQRRALLRETWFPGTPEEHARVEAATGLVFRFIVGHGSAEDEQMLQEKNSTHGDFFRVDVQESYLNLNRKIAPLCSDRQAKEVTSNKRWFEPQAWLLGSEYHLYASGAIYLLSYDVFQILNSIPNGRMRMLVNEDASMGAWMLAFDVSHEKTPSLCQKRCSRSAVAIWDAQCSGICHIERRMKELHTNGDCTASASNELADSELQPLAAAAPAVGPLAESPSGMDDRSADRLRYPGRKRVLGFVGVQTGFGSRKRRALLRETWFPATPEEHARVEAATGLVFRFIIGHGSAEDEQLLQAENSTHGDFLRIDVQESYLNLNRKTLVFFTSLFKLYEADFSSRQTTTSTLFQ
ncbi:unnamed protein product, partial [Closterium sp. Yama58-4]